MKFTFYKILVLPLKWIHISFLIISLCQIPRNTKKIVYWFEIDKGILKKRNQYFSKLIAFLFEIFSKN